jgi:arsenite transporter
MLGAAILRGQISVPVRILVSAARNLHFLVPASICAGAVSGQYIDYHPLKPLVLPLAMLQIYPSMMGISLFAVFRSFQARLIFSSFLVNFIIIPLVSYALGRVLLSGSPGLYAGLALASLLPTSSMTLTYTLLAGGNMPGALKITVLSLILGSVLSPVFLYVLVGQSIPFDIVDAVRTLSFVIFLPFTAAIITGRLLKRFMSIADYNRSVAPALPGVSAILTTIIICISVGMEAPGVAANPGLLIKCLAVQGAFYAMNYLVSVMCVRFLRLQREDGLALLYTTVLRNLAISIGIAAGMFGSQAAFMVSIAFLIQPVAAAWFLRANKRWNFI